MAFLAGPRLLDWASSPPHLQFNKFVLTGYRPASSGSGCLRSLFYLHNELGNIYTHGELRPHPIPRSLCLRRAGGRKAEERPSDPILGCPGPGTARSRGDKAAIVPDGATCFRYPGGAPGQAREAEGGPSPLNPSEPRGEAAWCTAPS